MPADRNASPLAGEKVVIIGGSSGIGLATARRALACGARLAIASRDEARLARAAESLGEGVVCHTLDVRDARTMDACFEAEGPIDHVVVTAVEVHPRPFLEMDIDEARRTFDVKFWGQFSAAQLAAPAMREGGSITLFSGVAA